MLSHFLRAVPKTANPLNTLSFVASTGVDAATITIPASAQAGDIAILFDAAADAVAFTIDTTISGWTKVINNYFNAGTGTNGSVQQQQVFVRILTTGDPGSTVTGSNVSTGVGAKRKAMAVFRGNVAINDYTFNNYNFEFSVNAPTNKTISSSTGTLPLVAIALYRSTGTGYTATFTPTQDGQQNGGSNTALMRWKIYSSSPSDITIGMTDGGNLNYLGGFYLSVFRN